MIFDDNKLITSIKENILPSVREHCFWEHQQYYDIKGTSQTVVRFNHNKQNSPNLVQSACLFLIARKWRLLKDVPVENYKVAEHINIFF